MLSLSGLVSYTVHTPFVPSFITEHVYNLCTYICMYILVRVLLL